MESMRILLINDNSAHVNWGAQASPQALVRILTAALPGCTVTALPHAWLTRRYRRMRAPLGGRLVTEGSRRWVGPVERKCSMPVQFFPEVADDFDFWADEWLAGRGGPQGDEFLELAGLADLVVYNGENSIYRNTPEGCHGLFLLWLATTRMSKPTCLVNHTADLNEVRPIMNAMVKLVYPRLDLVAVREPCSLACLQGLGIMNAELFPDVVFAQQAGDFPTDRVVAWRQQHGLEGQPYFCLSASGLPVSMPRGEWDGEVAALVRDLQQTGARAVLVAKDPWCLFLEDVARRTDSLFFGPEHEFHDLWPLFESASFLVTGHYHYVIFGAMVGCPFIPMSVNNHKMRGVCEHLSWHRTIPFDATFLRSCRTEIVGEAHRLREDRLNLSKHLVERAAVLQGEARRLGQRVAEVAQRVGHGATTSPGVLQ